MSTKAGSQQFIDLLLAAMLDAAIELKLTQLQTTITPPGGQPQLVRIVVIPEQMQFRLDGKGNKS